MSEFLGQSFAIFKGGSSIDTKPELEAYYDEYGWLDFLSELAKTKVFDIPGSGRDSIECVKQANAYKVLTWADNEREKNKALKAAYKLNE